KGSSRPHGHSVLNAPGRPSRQGMLVNGCAREPGRAIVGVSLLDDAHVFTVDTEEETGAELEADHADQSGNKPDQRPWFRRGDVAHEAALVNNADRNPYADSTAGQWVEILAVNLNATWLCAKHVLLVVKTIGRGPIVSVASLRANLTIVGMLRYAAAKPGVVGMTCSLAFEVG